MVVWSFHWRRLVVLVVVCVLAYGYLFLDLDSFSERISPIKKSDAVKTPSSQSPLSPHSPSVPESDDSFDNLPAKDTMPDTPERLTSIVQEAIGEHTATIIFLHGFGDSGAGWASVGEQFAPYVPHVKFIFPNAPPLPISINGGMLIPAWYDIDVSSIAEKKQDEAGLLLSRQKVMQIVKEEIEQNKIPTNRILIGGFSQGCVLGLLTALTADHKFAGIVGLSGYLPLHDKIMDMSSYANKNTPIFWGHGTLDKTVKYDYGEQTVEFLQKNEYKVQFHSYPHMSHSVNNQELSDLLAFIKEVLPQETPIMAKA
ncbi:hypothetical protein BGZ83_004251 [Gryganskiella cystojenkinii]|nr:hypothetical protein BGZ83_004251 [Gryganskiella cystojenkinii]